MQITSLNFFIFLAISVIIYYIFPKKYRWVELLITSLIFFLLSSIKVSYYFVFGIITSYIGTLIIDKNEKNEKIKRIVLFFTVSCQIALLILLKYINIIPITINTFGNLFNINTHIGQINLIAPIGISYYTLSIISYIVDVYRGGIHAEKNIFKYSLFACYYPCLISGPIIRFEEMSKQFFEVKSIDWNNLYKGFHRFIYGLMKKMLIADNIAIFVNCIFYNTTRYSGLYIIVGVILYAIQIYCDFSGCMDIVIGASNMYGVKLPENFESPFFSKNLSEFWRRWHITLGAWGKDYIMYPLLKSKEFQENGKELKQKYGKNVGKKVPLIAAICILWLFIGLWHGASYKYIFCAGILPWIYFTCNEVFEEKIRTITKKFKIKTETRGFRIFQSIRTLGFMCFIWIFAISNEGIEATKNIKNIFHLSSVKVDDFVTECLGKNINISMFSIIIIALIAVTIVDYLKYKGEDVQETFNNEHTIFKWIALFSMIIAILIYGAYGLGYNPVDFIYGGF